MSATDDEAFTYNHKVSRLPPVQEHFMILRALEHGVSEVRLARALDVDIASMRQKRDMLDGIVPKRSNF
ncbi:plasmid partitioning protein RepB C-terminal domain-containing protein [Anatilimnocola sp. NA78]|uniref:plasmid partitioning protein RepB C-terminal domain-containing protein n=1 Tax=Anatilimnocola sp. NA78 TaxID=3415683 RepID=UPI003CE4AEC5